MKGVLIAGCLFIAASPSQADDGRLVVHFLDVGAGDCILIETPTGDDLLIDGGDYGFRQGYSDTRVVVPYLRRHVEDGVLELVVLTHPDTDHYGGLLAVFDDFQVREFWDSGYRRHDDGPPKTLVRLYDAIAAEMWVDAEGQACPVLVRSPVMDDHPATAPFDEFGVTLQVVDGHDDPPGSGSVRINNASLVINMTYGEVSYLFTGDINGVEDPERPDGVGYSEAELLDLEADSPGLLNATVLKAPHHGSSNASTLPFLQAVSPTFVVFSAGSRFGHPLPEVVARYEGLESSPVCLMTNEGDWAEEGTRKLVIGDDCYVFTSDEAGNLTWEKRNFLSSDEAN